MAAFSRRRSCRPPRPATTDTQPFNLNTISQGVSAADFYLTVPQAIVKFLQSDVNTRFLAQTQLRGSEGAQLELKVGADEPYLTTSFSPIAGGGANVNPLSSYTFRTVGINVQRDTQADHRRRGHSARALHVERHARARRVSSAASSRPRFRREA